MHTARFVLQQLECLKNSPCHLGMDTCLCLFVAVDQPFSVCGLWVLRQPHKLFVVLHQQQTQNSN